MSSTTSVGSGCSPLNRMVPFEIEKPLRREATAATTSGLNGNKERCVALTLTPISGLPR